MLLRCFLVLCLYILSSVSTEAQSSYAIRLALNSIDTSTKKACYDLELKNAGKNEWYLGSSNLFLFYDYSSACLVPEESFLILDEGIYGLNDIALNAQKNANTGLPLSYAATLGSLRLGLTANRRGLLMDTSGTWHPIVRLCFDILFDDIYSEFTCFQANFINDQIQMFLPVVDIVETYDDNPNEVINVVRTEAQDIIPNATRNSCFINDENTSTLCSDGIDNDDDGLIDCDDTSGCSVMTPSFNINNPGGCDNRPSLIRVNGIAGEGIQYSIDDGLTFQSENEFFDLPAGDYEILVVRNGISTCGQMYAIRLTQEECVENNDMLCNDGTDNDADGLIDCDDDNCLPVFSDVVVISPDNCPMLNNGRIDLDFDPSRFSLSVDSGANFIALVELNELSAGRYNLALQNKLTGCISYYSGNPIILMNPSCPDESQDCSDGIDNDLDGLIDCLDPDCSNQDFCAEKIEYYIPNAISPESAINSSFGIYSPPGQAVTISSMTIFDRWGSVVHNVNNTSSADAAHFWKGTNNNTDIQPGVYIYLIVINQNGRLTTHKGSLTVVN